MRFLILFSLVLLFPGVVLAETAAAPIVKPSSFFLRLDKNSVSDNYISIRNPNDSEMNVLITRSPIESSDSFGGIKKSEDNAFSLHRWIELGSDRIVIPPKSSVTVPFRIRIPNHVPEGSYSGGIYIDSSTESIGIEKGIALYGNIGTITDTVLIINSIEPVQGNLEITIENTGKFQTVVSGMVRWQSLFGEELPSATVSSFVVMPQKQASLSIPFQSFFPGFYRAHFDAQYANGNKRMRKHVLVTHMGWVMVVTGSVISLVILYGVHILKKKHEKKHH